MATSIHHSAAPSGDTKRDLTRARDSALRWIQRWSAPGSELRLLLEDAVIDYDPQQFLAALTHWEAEPTAADLVTARRLGTRWARLADASSAGD